MICDSEKMALRVAIAGALKMNREGYTFVPFGAGGDVVRPDGFPYSVALPTPGPQGLSGICNCKFYAANQEWGTCKHIVFAGWQVEAAKEQALRDAEEDSLHLRYSDPSEGAECPTGCVNDKWRAIA
jgi:hypothetical protein